MAHYLVIHTPVADGGEEVLPPTQLGELARAHGRSGAQPRWIRAWSPDLHDDRIFSYWEAASAEEILAVIQKYGFLDNMNAKAISVHEWGPEDVLAVDPDCPALIDTMSAGYACLGDDFETYLAYVRDRHPARPGLPELIETA